MKQRIKQAIASLPFGSERMLLRTYALIKRVGRRARQYRRLRSEKKEADRLLHALRSGSVLRWMVVYDTIASPPTYGDYFFVVMLARYFTSQALPVRFVIVDDGRREDWVALNDAEQSTLITRYVEMARVLLPNDLATVEVSRWPEVKAAIDGADASRIVIPYCKEVGARQHVYGHTLNTLNHLCAKSDPRHLDRFLLSFEELAAKVPVRKPAEPYITWNCRHSTSWSLDRNTEDEEFMRIYACLRRLYPRHAIMIVSDAAGCDRFRQLARERRLPCLFSKDFSDSLLGDGALILGSSYFYMLRGGGIAVFPMFSRVPHERITPTSGEVAWRNGRATSWATADQLFRYPDTASTVMPTLSVTSGSEGRNACNSLMAG